MNFYCCVHSQAALNLHNELSSKLDGFVDKDIPYRYICGTKARNDFTTPVINAYDGNPTTPFNKKFRALTSIYHLLNNVETDRFFFNGCTFFLKKIEENRASSVDLLVQEVSGSIYMENGEYNSYIKSGLNGLIGQFGADHVVKFYKDNFNLDLLGKDNKRMQIFCSYINTRNPHVKEWFNRTLEPFMEKDNYRYFHQEIILLTLWQTYLEYQDRISICTGLPIKWYSSKEMRSFLEHGELNNYKAKDLHYYGD